MPGLYPDLGILIAASSIPPAARRANGTVNGTGVDMKNADGYAAAIVDSDGGTGTTPSLSITLQDSADNSTFAAVASGVVPTAFTAITTTASIQLRRFRTHQARRYVRAVGTTTGAAAGGHIYSVHFVYEQRPTVT